MGDFSVVLFRSDFVLVSEKNHMKAQTNQWADFSVVLCRSDFVRFSEQNHVKALKNQ